MPQEPKPMMKIITLDDASRSLKTTMRKLTQQKNVTILEDNKNGRHFVKKINERMGNIHFI